MKKILFFIFLIAAIFRLYNLHSIPSGFHADEVRVGWNAVSIANTFKDDFGNFLPLYYNTFGDFRPTGIIYLAIPFIYIFGQNEFAVRLASAILGAATIIPLFLLSYEITKSKNLSIISALLLALSPWHISTSRATSEVVISMFLSLYGLYFLQKFFSKNKSIILLISFIFLISSFFFYHSIRVLAPLFVLGIIFYNRQSFSKLNKKIVIIYTISILLFSLILLFSKEGSGRFSQVKISKNQDIQKVLSVSDTNPKLLFDNKYIVLSTSVFKEYLTYFSGDFLIGDSAKPIRYKTHGVGVLTYFEFILFFSGIISCIRNKKLVLPIILLLIAPIPASLTSEDSPNLHRSLYMLPFILIISSEGYLFLTKILPSKFIKLLILTLLAFNYLYFWQAYLMRSKFEISQVRNFSAKDLVVYLNEVKGDFDKIIITQDPDSPYAWYAYFNKLDPKKFNELAINRKNGEWQYENLVFTQKECPSGDIFPNKYGKPELLENVLVVDGFKCPVESKIDDGMQAKVTKQFKNPDGSISYTLWEKD